MKVKSLSCVRLFGTPWTAACQAPLSVGFSRQEYWSGVPLPFPQLLNCVQLFVTLWTVARQAPSSMGFSGQEYWSGVPFLPPGDLLNPGMELNIFYVCLHWQVNSLPLVPPGHTHINAHFFLLLLNHLEGKWKHHDTVLLNILS